MIIEIGRISWYITVYAWGSIVVLLSACLLIYRHQRVTHIIKALAAGRESVLFMHTSPTGRLVKAILSFIGICALGLTLFQPHWDKETCVADQYGRDIFVMLDISRSMLAQDVVPNRLDLAKTIIKELAVRLACERLGLVLFAGSAFIQCPLTEDHGAFNVFLDHVDVETISSGSTSLTAAFDQVIRAYERMPAKHAKLVILVTDGEDFSPDVVSLQSRIKEAGLEVFAIGVGTQQGAPIPLYDGKGMQIGHQKDSQGNVVISCHNESLLRDLVTQSGGHYVGAAHDGVSIKSIIHRIMSIEKELIEGSKTWVELKAQYMYFVAVSFLCFMLEWLL